MARFDYVMNVRDTQPKACTQEVFERILDSEQVARVCSQIGAVMAQVDIATTLTDEADKKATLGRLHDEVAALKRGLPAFTFFASFQGKARRTENAVASGLAYLDLDHVEDARALWASIEMSASEEVLGRVPLVHVTPSGRGLRLVFFLRPVDTSIEAAQAQMAAELGIQDYDAVCKDAARLSFAVPRGYVLKYDTALWTEDGGTQTANTPNGLTPDPSPRDEGSDDLRGQQTDVGVQVDGNHTGVRLFKGIPYTSIIAEWWRRTGGEPAEGERNVKLHKLAVNLRAICDNKKEVLMQVMPRFGLSDVELKSVVDSACKEPPKGISKMMQGIVDTLEMGISSDEIGDAEAVVAETGVKVNVRTLPIGLKESLVGVPASMHMPVLCGVLPIAAAYADQVEVEYCDGQRQHLGLMSIIRGEQASNKSVVKNAVDVWKRQFDEEDALARRREEEWKERKKGRKANEKAPEDPHVLIRMVPVTVSCSTLLKRFKNASNHTLYSFGEELDTLRKTNGAGSWSSKYDIYRLSFDRGEWGQDYNSDQAESGVVKVAYNWTMLGTNGAMRKCFKQDNIENGLSSRILVAEMPDSSFSKMPKFGRRSAEDEARIQEAVTRLRSFSGLVDTPRLRKAIGDWVEQKRVEAAKDIDHVKDIYRKRAAVIGFRCGVVHFLLSQESEQIKMNHEKCREAKGSVDFALMMAEYCLQQQMAAFGEALQSQYVEASEACQRYSVNHSVFDQLAPTFTVDDLRALKRGFCSEASLRKIISRWCRDKWIEKTDKMHWRKVESGN